MWRLDKNQRGDTIIEVLIVLAVLGLAIGITYATANRSILNARQAQESSKATVLLQSQIEALRNLAPLGTTVPAKNIFQLDGQAYCIDSSTNVVASTGNPNPCLLDGRYTVSILHTSNSFVLTAKWDDVMGQGINTATMTYRIYQ